MFGLARNSLEMVASRIPLSARVRSTCLSLGVSLSVSSFSNKNISEASILGMDTFDRETSGEGTTVQAYHLPSLDALFGPMDRLGLHMLLQKLWDAWIATDVMSNHHVNTWGHNFFFRGSSLYHRWIFTHWPPSCECAILECRYRGSSCFKVGCKSSGKTRRISICTKGVLLPKASHFSIAYFPPSLPEFRIRAQGQR